MMTAPSRPGLPRRATRALSASLLVRSVWAMALAMQPLALPAMAAATGAEVVTLFDRDSDQRLDMGEVMAAAAKLFAVINPDHGYPDDHLTLERTETAGRLGDD